MGILYICKFLYDKTDAQIVLNGILPKGPLKLSKDPVWDQISWINDRLECFASGVDGVSFFNATDIFLTNNKTMINKTTMDDFLHPSPLGSDLWGKAIHDRLLEMI